MNRELFVPIALQLFGVAVVIAEIVIPSGGLLGLLAVLLFGYSLYVVFHDISTAAGMVFVVVDIVSLPVLVWIGIKLLARSPATLSSTLSSAAGVSSQSPELLRYKDKEGEALTALHPAGAALIDGRRVDVMSRGEFIEKGSPVVVIEVAANRVVVRRKE